MTRAMAVLATVGLCALAGCGTVDNLSDHCTPYGGVRQDAKDGAEAWRECCLPPGHCVPPALDLMRVTYLFAFDLPLSAVGDTLTLPITVPATTNREEGVRADKAPVDAFTGRG